MININSDLSFGKAHLRYSPARMFSSRFGDFESVRSHFHHFGKR